MLTCDRAFALLLALEKRQVENLGPPATVFPELNELEKFGTLVSASPDALTHIRQVDDLCVEMGVGRSGGDNAPTIAALHEKLTTLETQLRSEMHRSFHSNEALGVEADKCVRIRTVLSLLTSHWLQDEFARAALLTASLPPRTAPLTIPGLPGLYAVTPRGDRAMRALNIRFQGKPFAEFFKGFDKSERALAAFAADVATLQKGIGAVPKMREQVVIGLIKSGKPAPQALGAYHAALGALPGQRVDPKGKMRPHRAVAAVRNDAVGAPQAVEQRIQQIVQMLVSAGLQRDPALEGAAKALLHGNPNEGVPRFVAIAQRLRSHVREFPLLYKFTARLLSAPGTPDELVNRVQQTGNSLVSQGGGNWRGVTPQSVALASMVRSDAEIPALCQKYLGISALLSKHNLCPANVAPDIALEAVTCPGSADDVVALIVKVASEIAHGKPGLSDVQIAAAFAKRFAF
jgi:hypothetical protein